MTFARAGPVSVGIISDTHGLLRPEVLCALDGVSSIIHAGDVGKEEILSRLAAIAPASAVRGNVDRAPWTDRLPSAMTLQIGWTPIYVLHDVHALQIEPVAAGIRVVISGHSHKPNVEEKDGVLYLNPGSAGPRRFRLPITVARLEISANGHPTARLIELAG